MDCFLFLFFFWMNFSFIAFQNNLKVYSNYYSSEITLCKTTKLLLTTVAVTNCWFLMSGAKQNSMTSWYLTKSSSLLIVYCNIRYCCVFSIVMRIFLTQPSQNIQAQQTNTHFRSGIWSCINRGCFGSTPQTVRSPGLEVEFYVTELCSRTFIRKTSLGP